MLRFLAVSTILAGTLSLASFGAASNGCVVAGTYGVRGTNANGSTYSGEAIITADAGGCRVKWLPPNTSEGTGTYSGGVLTINFVLAAEGAGVVRYVRAPNGQLIGPWWMNDAPGVVGTETLTPRN